MPENKPTHYRITVKDVFMVHNEMFRPGNKYTVTAEIYEGEVAGQPFKDRCVSVQPLFRNA